MSTHERAHQDEANNVTYQRCQFAYEFAVPYITGKDVLDVGCGNAYGTALMARSARNIQGVDYDAATVADNAQRYSSITNLSFRQGAVPPLPFPDQSFDVVTVLEVLEHQHDPLPMARAAVRLARRCVVVSVPSKPDDNPEHVQLFNGRSLTELLTRAGARGVRVEHVLNHIIAVAGTGGPGDATSTAR